MKNEEIRLLASLDGGRERERMIERDRERAQHFLPLLMSLSSYLCLCLLISLSPFPHLWVILSSIFKDVYRLFRKNYNNLDFFIVIFIIIKKMLEYLNSITKKLEFFSTV